MSTWRAKANTRSSWHRLEWFCFMWRLWDIFFIMKEKWWWWWSLSLNICVFLFLSLVLAVSCVYLFATKKEVRKYMKVWYEMRWSSTYRDCSDTQSTFQGNTPNTRKKQDETRNYFSHTSYERNIVTLDFMLQSMTSVLRRLNEGYKKDSNDFSCRNQKLSILMSK